MTGNRNLLREGPLAVVVGRLVIAVVDVVRDARLGETLAQVLGQGLPAGVDAVIPAGSEEEFDLDAELDRVLGFHGVKVMVG